MKCYIIKYCDHCGAETTHIPTTLSFVLDHILKALTRQAWPSERTPARYACSACDADSARDPNSRRAG